MIRRPYGVFGAPFARVVLRARHSLSKLLYYRVNQDWYLNREVPVTSQITKGITSTTPARILPTDEAGLVHSTHTYGIMSACPYALY